MRKSISIKVMLVASFLLSSFVANADKLDLSEGTMTTGGNASFRIAEDNFSTISGADMGWSLNVDFGYFIIDNLSIDVNVSTSGTFTNPISNAMVGGGIGGHYYFDLGSMINPYIALQAQILWSDNGDAVTNANWDIRVPVSAGVLIGLNSHVALDLGVQAGFTWGLSSASSATPAFDLTVGYVGVRAFF